MNQSKPRGWKGWWFPSILNEEEKEVYIPVPISGYPTTLAVGEYAREKFPGQSVSLDALCKRFSIDNKEREIHSATIDTELLARVYIELMDARELSLDLNVNNQHASSESNFDIQKIQNRELATRLTDDDKELHKAFVETLGENSIWKKKEQYNNE